MPDKYPVLFSEIYSADQVQENFLSSNRDARNIRSKSLGNAFRKSFEIVCHMIAQIMRFYSSARYVAGCAILILLCAYERMDWTTLLKRLCGITSLIDERLGIGSWGSERQSDS